MKRKIIQIAGSTHLVSLPKEWIVQNNVKKGDEVDVSHEHERVVITTANAPVEQSVTLDARSMKKFIFRLVLAVYKSGYDHVELIVNDPLVLSNLSRQITTMMPGFEIVDQQSDRVTIKNLSKVLDSEFDVLLRKIFLLLKTIGKNTHEVLQNKERAKLEEVLILEQTCARFCNFCERMLNKNGHKDLRKIGFLSNVVHDLAKLGSQYRHLCLYLLDPKNQKNAVKISSELLETLEKVTNLYTEVYELFYKYDPDKISPIAQKRDAIALSCQSLLLSKKTDPLVVHFVLSITDTTFTVMKSYLGIVVV